MSTPGQVFVSFASQDVEVANRFLRAIEAAGLSCWIAHRDIPPGTSYPTVITAAIQGAAAILVIVTPASNASPHVLREVEMAFNAGKPILPVHLTQVALSPNLAYFLSTKQWLDAGTAFDDEDAAPVIAGLRQLLALPPPRPSFSAAPGGRGQDAARRRAGMIAAVALVGVVAAALYFLLRTSGNAVPPSTAVVVPEPPPGQPVVPPAPEATAQPPTASPPSTSVVDSTPTSGVSPVAPSAPGSPDRAAPTLPEPHRAFRLHPVSGQTYMWIPAGMFTMGCSSGDTQCDEDEQPAHDVSIKRPFWIGRTEVTGAQYRAVIKAGGGASATPDSPITELTWADARAYCKAAGGRLPTEAEWEYAARAGTLTRLYGALDSIGWSARNSQDHAHPVGLLKPNRFGLFDMLGNVHEWVLDRYFNKYDDEEDDAPVVEPVAANALAVVRGGAWTSMPRDVRLSARLAREPDTTDPNVGFRCVLNQ